MSYNKSTTQEIEDSLRLIDDLKFFLATAPANWQENQVIRRYYLNHDEGFVSCVYWNNLYFITGTDIVRCIVYKFEHFGRKIIDRKKFEEGIFSDLRNLKCNTDAILEPPRSEFLEFLFKNSCLRTQKKQKVFFWFNVPHDKLMADALERDLKKEKLGQKPTTIAHKEPALSFKYDENSNLFAQLTKHIENQSQNGAFSLSKTSALNTANSTTTATSTSDDCNLLDQKSSPEYSSSTTNWKNGPKYLKDGADHLFRSKPNQSPFDKDEKKTINKKASDNGEGDGNEEEEEDDDDFPLDYFVSQDNNDSYITLDSNYEGSSSYAKLFEDVNGDEFLDPSLFIPSESTNAASNQVVFNDEYLIEQTQPLKTPLPPSMPASSARAMSLTNQDNLGDEFFSYPQLTGSLGSNYQIPMSAKLQTAFKPPVPPQQQTGATGGLATPQFLKVPQQQMQVQSQAFNSYDQQPYLSDVNYNYNLIHPDSEYWTTGQINSSLTDANSILDYNLGLGYGYPVQQHPMMYMNDELMPYFVNQPIMVPQQSSMAALHQQQLQQQQQQQQQQLKYQSMTRQQQISNKMMTKKRQMQQQQQQQAQRQKSKLNGVIGGGGITKKSVVKVEKPQILLNEVVNSKTNRISKE
ncbi:STE like transcription factor family protein [Candida parapsilosis]|uniref:Transcription factor CPH1 n=2 Tax=Candida parapsilosis TaxID=5480 RepID=G8BD70_CANPC|nr:uncharacterized protein CPAR2_208600 [Candida parapsilosis]KAF6054634.1 STE like transcription factor family protein [Candida parapsilosis]KAF6056340.1 STE like transcription factor family protein [Candida parapsilosis]KAF6059273.1 STE like transcription factor family protein [Candida parapsilosis]KAF6068030.1 STE like transcription factor family protein [Candida parapsilosis]KAI5904075.1 Transcription factor CPH1 [Candida parapsilosis]